MPRIPSWHADEEDVHHDNTECVRAARIREVDRLGGDGGKPLCPVCARLDDAEASLATREQ
jgi:hypothetical protein